MKIKVGIEIDEILRAKWLQFDRFYVEEFGDNDINDNNYTLNHYTLDFFNVYKFEDTEITERELKEPEDMIDNINPAYYQVNDKGESLADTFLFKPAETKIITAKEMYNNFMYQDYCFEIHSGAPFMYKGMDKDISDFILKYSDYCEFTIYGYENYFSIPPTLMFLSRMMSRFKNIKFVNSPIDMLKESDIVITTSPEILKLKKLWFKKIIKVKRPYNEKYNSDNIEILQIKDLINNKKFQKIIKYKENNK